MLKLNIILILNEANYNAIYTLKKSLNYERK